MFDSWMKKLAALGFAAGLVIGFLKAPQDSLGYALGYALGTGVVLAIVLGVIGLVIDKVKK